MPTGMSDFIDTFFKVEETRLARQRQEMLERESRTNQAMTAVQLAQMVTSPTGRESLVAMLDDPDMGAAIMEAVPGAGALGRFAAMRGFEALPEDERDALTREATFGEFAGRPPEQVAIGSFLEELASTPLSEDIQDQLGRAFLTRGASGQLPGQLAIDSAIADLPQEEIDAAARMALDLELTPFQTEQVAEMAARHHLQMMDLAQRGALGILGLMVQSAIAEGRATAADGPTANQLMESISQALAGIASNPESDEEMLAHVVRYNTAIARLTDMGFMFDDGQGQPILAPLPTDISQMRSGWFRRTARRIMRKAFGRSDVSEEMIRHLDATDPTNLLIDPGQRPPAPSTSPQELMQLSTQFMRELMELGRPPNE